MSTAIINVEFPTSNLSDEAAFLDVLLRVRRIYPRSIGELQRARYQDAQQQQIDTPVAVITIQFYNTHQELNAFLFGLSAVLDQDCIAVLHDDGLGELVGPCAAAWGTFDIHQFHGPALWAHLRAA